MRSKPCRTRGSPRRRADRWWLGGLVALLVVAPSLALAPGSPALAGVAATHAGAIAALDGLRVVGDRLESRGGAVVALHGVDRDGTEYECVEGRGIFDGPSGPASVAAMVAWHVNAVRIPLNEDCWLGINGVPSAYSGAAYRSAIVQYVQLLRRNGIYAEVVLAWGAPGEYQATYAPPAPDEDHAPAAWASMATAFRGDPDVILSPWAATTLDWSCFMASGCDDAATYGPADTPYQTASMQQAVQVMRQAGYDGVIAIPCLDDGNVCGAIDGSDYDGSTWLRSRPYDPQHQLVAEAAIYGKDLCDTATCLTKDMGPVAGVVPLLLGQVGESDDGEDCGTTFISAFLGWADAHGVGYEASSWNTGGRCSSLITSYGGTPNAAYGRYVQRHFAAVAQPVSSRTGSRAGAPHAAQAGTPRGGLST